MQQDQHRRIGVTPNVAGDPHPVDHDTDSRHLPDGTQAPTAW